ncbi:hypothetical protein HanRHA438_Chr03g0126921 [Helianthus annuus]|nr:hypothetical protein HanRHA438_Chr03g0126921 [Helianthus annuus]
MIILKTKWKKKLKLLHRSMKRHTLPTNLSISVHISSSVWHMLVTQVVLLLFIMNVNYLQEWKSRKLVICFKRRKTQDSVVVTKNHIETKFHRKIYIPHVFKGICMH